VALLRTIKHPYETHAVFEDPTLGSNKVYFQHDAYNKETITPLFDVSVNHNTTGTGITGFGQSSPQGATGQAGGLILGGNQVWVNQSASGTTNNNALLNLDPSMFLSMDPNRPIRHVRYDTDGVDSAVWIQRQRLISGFETSYMFRFNPATDCSDTLPRLNTNSGSGFSIWAVYLNPATKNLVCLSQSHSGTPVTPAWSYGYRFTSYFSNSPVAAIHPTQGQNRTKQFLGISDLTGNALFITTDVSTDHGFIVVTYNDFNNTATVLLNTFSAVPVAGGTSVGGARGTTFGGIIPKYLSSTFTDPTDSRLVGFYAPYFDTNGRYHPLYLTWNKEDDSFVRNTDITVNWGTTNQDAIWLADTLSATSASIAYGLQRIWHNETFVVGDEETGDRYLTFMQLHGGSVYDSEARRRTFLTFQVNSNDPKNLTYHSSVVIPATPRNIIWLNDAKTLLGVITNTAFYTYSFNPTTGWTQSASLPFQFWEIGKDTLGRIWALDRGPTGYHNIHLITLNVPINIIVTSPQSTYNFTGTPITSQLVVNAYDPSGSRIQADIKLVIDGGSMTFAGANLTTTITTSDSEDSNVPITITGGGISNIVASVVL
jgi:hypothetical protein